MSEKRHRLSGAEYRKRKLARETKLKKQSGSLEKYLKTELKDLRESSKSVSEITGDSSKDLGESSKSVRRDSNSDNTDSDTNVVACSSQLVSDKPTEISSDPAMWPDSLPDDLRIAIVKKGPPEKLGV